MLWCYGILTQQKPVIGMDNQEYTSFWMIEVKFEKVY